MLPIHKHYHWLIKQQQVSKAGLMMAIATGALWPEERRANANLIPGPEATCPLCGANAPDEWHMFWTCPYLATSQHPHITKTQYLTPQALARQPACLWVRGLPPLSWMAVGTPPTDWTAELGEDQDMGQTVEIFTDGSGGKNNEDPRIRRCGWAWVHMVPNTTNVSIGQHGGMAGPQTVPRAELMALNKAVQACSNHRVTNVTLYTDCCMVSRSLLDHS